MTKRKQMYEKLSNLLDGFFIYGSFREQPASVPYGNYAEVQNMYKYADNKPYLKRKDYIVRIVMAEHDEDLEDSVEEIFEELEIPYRKITCEDIIKEHCFCSEWEICLIK